LIAAAALATAASAHDVGAEYDSRGQCEAALAKINVEDAEFLVSIGEFDTYGEAFHWFHDVFRCDRQGDKWVLVFDPE
jgi:hypothetical protein